MKIWLPTMDHLGGLRRFCEYLAEGFIDAGHEAQVQPFPMKDQYSPSRLRRLRQPAGTDIILANSWSALGLARPGARLVAYDQLGIHDPAYAPYRTMLQALFHETLLRRRVRAGLEAADAVVAVSRFVAGSLKRTFGDRQIHVIPNGIDTESFRPHPEGKTALDGRPVRLLFAGDLIVRKGADLLGPLMKTLGPGFELLCVGGGRSNIRLPDTPEIRQRQGLTSEEMVDVYRWADLLVFPTRLEGFGFVAAEALACGTPVIAANTSALPEVVEDRVCGRLCPADDVAGFAQAIRETVANQAQLAELGKKARERAVEYFDRHKMVARYLELFEHLTLRSLPFMSPPRNPE